MKKVVIFLISILFFNIYTFAQLQTLDVDNYNVYTKEEDKVIDDSQLWDDPLRQWATDLASNTNGIANDPIDSSEDARNQTLNFIKKLVNYTLSLLSFIIVLYILYWWIVMLTAWGDNNKYKEGFDRVKIGALIIILIWLSWLIISFLFYIVNRFIS